MYVKLVTPSAVSASWYYIRDICRLLTAATPSTSLLTAFTSSSVVVDATAAGWTYVGATLAADRPTPSTSVSDFASNAGTPDIWALSAPCLEGSTLKYITLSNATSSATPTTTNQYINLTAARSVTSLGVATNEGIRFSTTSASVFTTVSQTSMQFPASSVIHLIATPRGVTLIYENVGLMGVWETTMTDPHRFYGTAPVCVWQNGNMSGGSTGKTGVFTTVIPQSNIAQTSNSFASCVMNITDVNTGTVYGPVEPVLANSSITNSQNWMNDGGDAMRKNSISSTGTPVYQVSPIYVQPGQYGYPVMYVTGVYNAYWCKPGLGNTGDTVSINGSYYTYFNSGPMVGFLAQTS